MGRCWIVSLHSGCVYSPAAAAAAAVVVVTMHPHVQQPAIIPFLVHVTRPRFNPWHRPMQ